MQIVGVFGLLIALYWVVALVRTLRRPSDWQPPGTDQFPIRVTRSVYLVACVLGIGGGLAIFVYGSFLLSGS